MGSLFDDFPAVVFAPDRNGVHDGTGESDDALRAFAHRYTLRTPILEAGDIAWRDDHPTRVGRDAPDRVLAAVFECAENPKREMRFDFLQFDPTAAARASEEPWEAWAFAGGGTIRPLVVGAACFHDVTYTDIGRRWTLSWAWLHPLFRRRGHLRRAWPYFLDRYGPDFVLAPPLSDAMEAFVAAVGHPDPSVDPDPATGPGAHDDDD